MIILQTMLCLQGEALQTSSMYFLLPPAPGACSWLTPLPVRLLNPLNQLKTSTGKFTIPNHSVPNLC